MNKTIILMLVALLLPLGVLAQTTDVAAGLTPDRGVLYGLDLAIDNFRVSLAQGAVSKALLRLEIADERLAEFQNMNEWNKSSEASRAKIELDKEEKEISDLKLNMSEEQIAAIKERSERHIAVLERVRAKLAEKGNTVAANSLSANIDREKLRVQNKIGGLNNG